MEGRRLPPKKATLGARLTASTGRSSPRTVGCQNCNSLKFSECVCVQIKSVASTSKIETSINKGPLRNSYLNPNLKDQAKLNAGRTAADKSESVALQTKTLPPSFLDEALPLEQICLIHNKPLDVICTVDLSIICSSCAIFGHKGHDFKSVNEFQADKLKRCQDILQLTDAKKSLEQKLCSKASKERISEQFSKLSDQLISQVRMKYGRLVQLLQKNQEMCVQKIRKSISQQSQRLNQLLVIPVSLINSYKQWEVHAYQQIQAFQDDQLVELQMKMLNYDKKLTEDITKRGNHIVEELKHYYEDVSGRVRDALNSFVIGSDVELEKKIAKSSDIILKKRARESSYGNLLPSSDDLLLNQDPKPPVQHPENKQELEQLPQISINSRGIQQLSMKVQAKQMDFILSDMDNQTQRQTLSALSPDNRFKIDAKVASLLDSRPTATFKQQIKIATKRQTYVQQRDSYCQTLANQQTQTLRTSERKPRISLLDAQVQKPINPSAINSGDARGRMISMISPDKQLGSWPSIRSIVSPNKLKQTAQNRVKKALAKLKLPDKYQKLAIGVMTESLEVLDLSNCSIDQTSILCVVELLKGNKSVRTLKLIRNRLTDDFVEKILPFILNITTLNLSQNYLTQKSLDAIMAVTNQLPSLRNVVMSQNRIRQKACKGKLEQLKKMNIALTF